MYNIFAVTQIFVRKGEVMKNYVFSDYDFEAFKILDGFLPEKLFDMHMHLTHLPTAQGDKVDFALYYKDMKAQIGNRELFANAITFPCASVADQAQMQKSVEFLKSQLDLYKNNVGEIVVLPTDSVEDIEKRLIHPNIKGLKPYHSYSANAPTFNADIQDYLPESAWEVANKRKMFITLHLVKDKSLADEENLNYIINTAKKYPDAILILAHCARAFASWTVFDVVDKLKNLDNVWYDFSGVCESPAMLYIMQKIGIDRCLWGTDYPISMLAGKAISIADTFYWIGEKDLQNFSASTPLRSWHVGTEGLMAIRQAFKLFDATEKDKEKFFYDNAINLINR